MKALPKNNGKAVKAVSVESCIDEEDKSVLRPPVDISVRGVGDLIKTVSAGTPEVQNLLLRECDVVYECKVCRNLFRSLANFISHKRVYCTQAFNHFSQKYAQVKVASHALTVQNLERGGEQSQKIVCVEPEEPDPGAPVKVRVESVQSCTNHLLPVPGSTVTAIAERLSGRGGKGQVQTSDDVPASALYAAAQAFTAHASQEAEAQTPVVDTQTVDESSICVFQTLQQKPEERPKEAEEGVDMPAVVVLEKEPTTMKTQLVELNMLVSRNVGVLQEDGSFKVSEEGSHTMETRSTNSSSKSKHVCNQCQARFLTVKTMLRHVAVHHRTRICYQCPMCRLYLPSPWAVYRHLSKNHHKTEEQIRKLRGQVLAKAVKRNLSEDKERERAIEGAKEREKENEKWINSYEGDLRCGCCGKLFNRRVALNVHAAGCKGRTGPATQRDRPSKKQTQPAPLPSTTHAVRQSPRITIQIRKDYNKAGKVIDSIVTRLRDKKTASDKQTKKAKGDVVEEKEKVEEVQDYQAGLVPTFVFTGTFEEVVEGLCVELKKSMPHLENITKPFKGWEDLSEELSDFQLMQEHVSETLELWRLYEMAEMSDEMLQLLPLDDSCRPLSPAYSDIPDSEPDQDWSQVNGSHEYHDHSDTMDIMDIAAEVDAGPEEHEVTMEECPLTCKLQREEDHVVSKVCENGSGSESVSSDEPSPGRHHDQFVPVNGLSCLDPSLADHSYLKSKHLARSNRLANNKDGLKVRRCLSRSRCRSIRRAVKHLNTQLRPLKLNK